MFKKKSLLLAFFFTTILTCEANFFASANISLGSNLDLNLATNFFCDLKPLISSDEIAKNHMHIFFKGLAGYNISQAERGFLDYIHSNYSIEDAYSSFLKNSFYLRFGFENLKISNDYLENKSFYKNRIRKNSDKTDALCSTLNYCSEICGRDMLRLIFSRGPITNRSGNIFDQSYMKNIAYSISEKIENLINCPTYCRCCYVNLNHKIQKLNYFSNSLYLAAEEMIWLMKALNQYEPSYYIYQKNESIISNINTFFKGLQLQLKNLAYELKLENGQKYYKDKKNWALQVGYNGTAVSVIYNY